VTESGTLRIRTVFAEALTVFDNLRAMERELEQLTHKMAELDPADVLEARSLDVPLPKDR